MSQQVAGSIILISFLFHIGCYSTVQLTNDELFGSKQGDISIATKASRGYHLTAYHVRNDTLYGKTAEAYTAQRVSGDSIAIPISEIAYVKVRELDGTKTSLVLASVAVVAIPALVTPGSSSKIGEGLGKAFNPR